MPTEYGGPMLVILLTLAVTVAGGLLVNFLWIPFDRWFTRRPEPATREDLADRRRIDDQVAAIDEYAGLLKSARDAASRVNFGLVSAEETLARRVVTAHNAILMVEDGVDRLRPRLPAALHFEADEISTTIRLLTSKVGAELASTNPEFKQLTPEFNKLTQRLSLAWSKVQSERARLLGA